MGTSAGTDVVSAFVRRLARARERLGPGGIAALRRGVNRSIGEPAAAAQAFFALIPPSGPLLEPAAWTSATLWARHELHGDDGGSFGASLGRLPAPKDEAVADRLLARVLSSDRSELPPALWRCIGLLRDREIRIDYARLTWDIAKWDHQDRGVQRSWARDFYGARQRASNTPEPVEG